MKRTFSCELTLDLIAYLSILSTLLLSVLAVLHNTLGLAYITFETSVSLLEEWCSKSKWVINQIQDRHNPSPPLIGQFLRATFDIAKCIIFIISEYTQHLILQKISYEILVLALTLDCLSFSGIDYRMLLLLLINFVKLKHPLWHISVTFFIN